MTKLSANADAIWEVSKLLDTEYIQKHTPPDMETFERWQANTFAYLKEGYHIRRLRNEHLIIVDTALEQWKTCESLVLRLFNDSHDQLDDWFSSLHESIWREKTVPLRSWGSKGDRTLYKATELSRRVVVNINWCRIFSAFLPLSLPERGPSLAKVGLMMSTIFYLEGIADLRDRNDTDYQVSLNQQEFEQIDSYWRRAKELCRL